jgi:hypothetical protein
MQGSFFDDDWKLDFTMRGTVMAVDAAEEAAREAKQKAERAEMERKAAEARRERERAREEQRAKEREEARKFHEEWERARKARQQYNCDDPWVILGVRMGASKGEIRLAWIRLVKQHHPDQGGDPAIFRKVQAAWERLRGKE